VPAPAKLLLASSNPGKLREYRAVARTFSSATAFTIDLLPDFAALPPFSENAPTFAENAAGKALHYSRWTAEFIFADDSGLVVPALGGAPGVHSARYAGEHAGNPERIAKLLGEMSGKSGTERKAHFVCAIALVRKGSVMAVVTDRVDGELLEAPRGSQGFGYDPIFFFPPLGRTFAELSPEEKNLHSHRGKAFRKLLSYLLEDSQPVL